MMEDIYINTDHEAFNLFQCLKSKNLPEIKLRSQLFSNYLDNLCLKYFPKIFKEKFIYQWTLKNVFELNEKEYETYCKTNLIAANQSLKRILIKLSEIQITDYQVRLLTDFVCDLKPFIKRFDSLQNYDWLILNTNTHISNFYFDLLSNTFLNGNIGEHPEEKLVLGTSTTFFIRQAIEYKIKRVLGIEYILLDGKPDIRSMDKFLKAIESNKIYYKVKFDFDILKTIYSWTHTYIHGGYRPEPWKTETAINYLSLIYYNGETSNVNSYSLYAGIEVNSSELASLKINTEETLTNEAGLKKLFISWLSKPEVAIVN
jgi:hypothetical protein